MRIHEAIPPMICIQPTKTGCTELHAYYCRFCGDRFETSEGTFFKQGNGEMLLREFYPFCQFDCVEEALEGRDVMAVKYYSNNDFARSR